MTVEEYTDRVNRLIQKGRDLVILSFLGTLTDGWINVSEDQPYTTVDIKLPTADIKKVINNFSYAVREVSTWEAGQIESLLFGELILKGLIKEAEERGLETRGDVATVMVKGIQEFKELLSSTGVKPR